MIWWQGGSSTVPFFGRRDVGGVNVVWLVYVKAWEVAVVIEVRFFVSMLSSTARNASLYSHAVF